MTGTKPADARPPGPPGGTGQTGPYWHHAGIPGTTGAITMTLTPDKGQDQRPGGDISLTAK